MDIRIFNLEDLNREGLIRLLRDYDDYVKEIIEDGDFLDRAPVCISEYLNNDFKENNEIDSLILSPMITIKKSYK